MIDGHMHLEYGPLNIEYVMEFVKEAVNKGLDEIQILDHTHRFVEYLPIYEDLKEAAPQQKEWLEKKELNTLAEYHALIEQVKAMELPIKVKFGLEVCYSPIHEQKIKELLALYPYDFVVGSIHSIDSLLYDMSSFSKDILWNKFSADHIYKRYYEIMEELIKSDLFTQVGHPDTLKLFQIYPSYDLKPTYHHIAKLMKEHNVLAENNTGCYYRYNHPDMGLSNEFLNILKEEGVKIITASDAHHPLDVGTNIADITNK
ncbi:MAG: histidinol-phosphatase HisJ family protein [Erysipelotrichaceae bacterium]